MSDPPARVQRRLAAVLAADIAGYSALMGSDEARTVRDLKQHQSILLPMINQFDGRIIDTAGDGILAEFGSIVNAVECATAIQQSMAARNEGVEVERRMEFRVGINVGDVIYDDNRIYGDGINIAARLEALAPPGGIVISEEARRQVQGKVAADFVDLGEKSLKNIAQPVRVFRVDAAGIQDHARRQHPVLSRITTRHRTLVFAGVGVLLAVFSATFWGAGLWRSDKPLNSPGTDKRNLAQMRPALIVLPFVNLSGDAAQDYFSDAFTEDITTALARTPGLVIVARNTAYTYKGKAVDAQSLGQKLGVRYMLEGSARRIDNMMRVTAQLIETVSGTLVWAERFDRPFAEVFKVQDELVNRIVGSVAARLRRREGQRALEAPPETLAAYELTARASLLFRKNTPVAVGEARQILRRAITIDPNYAKAHTVLSRVENFFFTSRISEEYAEPATAARVVAAAARGVELAPDDAYAHAVFGMALRLRQDYDQALIEAKRAKELAPTDSQVLSEVASVQLGAGDYRGVVQTVRLAWSLDPYLSPVFIGAHLSQALFALGDFAGAKEAANACLQRAPNDVRCVESLVRALGELGPKAEATRAVKRLLHLSPSYTVSEYKRRASKNRRDKDAIERWAQGLRKAGMPN
ncbi:MAG TPA: adenylate/guanylate cyclase domain-containing protein [Hyphomicrobiaceae bacterium]|nr:adenylate/guanylate cyclase domain-containing protein [Hyphomicrobiaceae bacterium]